MSTPVRSPGRLTMLNACGNPGSALAYHHAETASEAGLLHRDSPGSAVARPFHAAFGWVERLFDRMDAWSWKRQMEAREAYLAQAQDVSDLEVRMRKFDDPTQSRGFAMS